MKKAMLIGSVACGKTTLCRKLNGMSLEYKKTQAVERINDLIDTPGEYLEHRRFFRSLVIIAAEADVVLFLQDAGGEKFMFSPGNAGMFSVPVIGVVTKIDSADDKQIKEAEDLLRLAGAEKIFKTSAVTGEGIMELLEELE